MNTEKARWATRRLEESRRAAEDFYHAVKSTINLAGMTDADIGRMEKSLRARRDAYVADLEAFRAGVAWKAKKK